MLTATDITPPASGVFSRGVMGGSASWNIDEGNVAAAFWRGPSPWKDALDHRRSLKGATATGCLSISPTPAGVSNRIAKSIKSYLEAYLRLDLRNVIFHSLQTVLNAFQQSGAKIFDLIKSCILGILNVC